MISPLFKRIAFSLALLVLPSVSNAIPITVNGTTYDIGWQIGTFNEVNAERDLMSQLWWSDRQLGVLFAQQLGFLNDGDPFPQFGPVFATIALDPRTVLTAASQMDGTVIQGSTRRETNRGAWAFVGTSSVPVPEPTTLALFAIGIVGLRVVRLDKRLTLGNNQSSRRLQ